jgi:hypothetical protein
MTRGGGNAPREKTNDACSPCLNFFDRAREFELLGFTHLGRHWNGVYDDKDDHVYGHFLISELVNRGLYSFLSAFCNFYLYISKYLQISEIIDTHF